MDLSSGKSTCQPVGDLFRRPAVDPCAVTTMRLVASFERCLPRAGDLNAISVTEHFQPDGLGRSRAAACWSPVSPVSASAQLNSAFHCATEARYSSLPLRVAALRLSSRRNCRRDCVRDGGRSRALQRLVPAATRSLLVSANDKYLPDTGFDMNKCHPATMPEPARTDRLTTRQQPLRLSRLLSRSQSAVQN
jgi:hypothetical protein